MLMGREEVGGYYCGAKGKKKKAFKLRISIDADTKGNQAMRKTWTPLFKRPLNVAFIKCFICQTAVKFHNTNLPLMVRSLPLLRGFISDAQTA